MTDFTPNPGKEIETIIRDTHYLRLPIKTRLIRNGDDLAALLEEYARPIFQLGDLLFISEKIVCLTQGDRIIRADAVETTALARFLATKVRNGAGTPEFKGLGHGTAPAMQLLIEEAGVLRVLFAAAVSAITRPLGIKGAFYYIIGKQAKSIDCPMSWTIEEFRDYAKRAPREPNRVAREMKKLFGIETAIVDANYQGAFSLGKSTWRITEKFIREVLHDNPAGQDSEMTPFFIIRKA